MHHLKRLLVFWSQTHWPVLSRGLRKLSDISAHLPKSSLHQPRAFVTQNLLAVMKAQY